MRDTHQISFFLQHGIWLKRYDIAPCPKLRSCCNPRHIKRRGNVQHKTLTRDFSRVSEQLNRQSAFSRYLARAHPDLHWLVQLLGDNAGQFLSEHEGQTIKLEMTIPPRSQLIEETRAIDCFSALAQASDRMTVCKQLQTQYQCTEAIIHDFAKLGKLLMDNIENRE